MNATNKRESVSKLMKAWESKNAKRAAQGAGLTTMAVTLAACGGSDTTTTTPTTPVTPTVSSFSLTKAGTTDLDTVDGTSGADVFNAAAGRLNDGDVVNGLGGADVLNATINGSADAFVTGVETLNITALGASSIEGVRIIGATNINVDGGGTLTLAGAAAGITYGVSGAGTALTLTQAGSDASTNSVAVTLGAGKAGTLTLGDSGGVDFETINLTVAGVGSATLTEATTPSFVDDGDSIVVTGSGDYTLTIDAGAMGEHATAATKAVVDASGHTGTFTLDLTTLDTTAKVVSAEGYTGVDVIRAGIAVDGQKITSIASGTKVLLDTAESDGTSTVILTPRTGSNDSINVELAHGTAGTIINLTSLTVDGFETATVTSAGTNKLNTNGTTTTVKNVIGTIAGTATDKNLTIAGDKHLTAGVENTWTSITVTNTAGSDLTVAAGGELTYVGGAGNDRLELDTLADITASDSLNGGAGKDTLALSQTIGTDFSTAQLARISGFEVLEYEGAQDIKTAGAQAIDLTKITGVNELYINGALTTDTGGKTLTVTAEDGLVLTMGAHDLDGGAADQLDLKIKDAAVAGSANTVTVNLVEITGDATNGGFQIDGVETLNLNVKGDTSHTYTLSDVDGVVLQAINIGSTNTGTNTDGTLKASDSLTITDVESTILSSINASTFTGALNISGLGDNLSVTGATITGGSGANTIYGGSGADTITTGKGADTIRGGLGADNITTGAGGDTVLAATGADSTPESRAFTIGDNTTTTADKASVTVLGKTFSVTYGNTGFGVTGAIDTVAEYAAALAYQVNNDADLSKLVSAAISGAGSNVITITSLVDGNFVDFDAAIVSTGSTITLTKGTAADGTASTDIDVVNLGSGADFVHTGGGVDLIDLGAGDAATDTVYVLTLAEGGSKIANFEAGTIGTDVIKFAGDLLNNGSSEASTLVSIANTGATADNRVFFEITTATAAGGADTAAEIATHLANVTLTSIASGDDILFAVNDGTDTYLWAFTEDGTAGIQADDLALVGVLNGVTDIINGDLAQIA